MTTLFRITDVTDALKAGSLDNLDGTLQVTITEYVRGLQGATGLKGDTGDVTPAAEAARDAAQAAQAAAESAATTASGYATAAGISASSASGSATVAQEWAVTSSGYATIAEQAASSVENLQVGTTTTGAPGSSASVADSGTPGHPILDFTIPRGDPGTDGAPGADGAPGSPGSPGSPGTAATIAVGTVSKLAPGSAPTFVNSGSSSAAVFDVGLVTGDKGDTGPAGAVTGQVLYFDNTASDLTKPSVTGTTYAFVNSNPDTITTTGTSFVTLGFVAGQKITVSGAAQAGNNATFVVTAVAADKLTLATINALTTEAAGATVTIRQDRERLTRAPAAGTEQDESQSIVLADGDVTLDGYLTPAGYPGALSIPAGTWTFHCWSYVSSTTGTVTTIKFQVAKVDGTTGVATTLFTTNPTTITATTLGAAQEVSQTYTVTNAITLTTTDRLIVRVIGNNSSSTARVLHFVYQGNTRASHIETSLPVSGVGVPVGGAAGTHLMKASASDYDTTWSSDVMTLATPQTVSGIKTFSVDPVFNNGSRGLSSVAKSTMWTTGMGANYGNVQMAADLLTLSPYPVATAHTLDRIGVQITTGGSAGAVIRLGIFKADANGVDLTRVLDAGTIDGTQGAGVYAITISQALTPGLYWLGAVSQGGPTTRPTIKTGQASFGAVHLLPATVQANLDWGHAAGLVITSVSGAFATGYTSGARYSIASRVDVRIA